MNKRISRLMSWVHNSLASWREKSTTFIVFPNKVKRYLVQFSLPLLEASMIGKRGSEDLVTRSEKLYRSQMKTKFL